MKRSLLRATTAWVATAGLLNPTAFSSPAWAAVTVSEPTLTLATQAGTTGAAQARDPGTQTQLTLQAKIALLRQKVKYVFVLFQENRSFDHYFGTYPGANGLYATYPGAPTSDPFSQPANAPSNVNAFNSVVANVDGSYSVQQPFLIPRTIENINHQTVQLYPEDTYSVDHSHTGYANDFHYDAATHSIPRDDGYSLDQEGLHYATDASCAPGTPSGPCPTVVNASNVAPTANPNLQTKQKGEIVKSHVDCDTIPFLWQYADRFVLFDNFHQTATGPSTPNAIAMIAGQVGDTQWVKHPNEADTSSSFSLPNLNDNPPFTGSATDTSPGPKPPYGPDESTNGSTLTGPYIPKAGQINLTFATLPLSFMGSQIGSVIRTDEDPAADLVDVQHDVLAIAVKDTAISWGWYQQGYGPEPFDGKANGIDGISYSSTPEHASYVVHHNGPQYFGYIGDNPAVAAHLHSLQQLYTDIANHALPASGGVFYVRGGFYNNDNLKVVDPNPNVEVSTPGNDDHPNYSDAQISEASIADSVNAIAGSPYWSQSAIIITYDETDGLFDHVPEKFRTYGPDHRPETGGPRIPAIVISPYAAAHTVSHVYSEHSAVIKFIDELFNLTPLASLPDEAAAAAAGAANAAFNAPNGSPQPNLGPADGLTTMGDLTEAFDNDRLLGNVAPLPASYAMIPASQVHSLPHDVGTDNNGNPTYGCQYLGIVPTDYPGGTYVPGGETDPPPADFNPRPTQSPGSPYYNTSNNTTPGSATGTGTGWPN
ncbi:MAG TPA: alkaline phosphatase family protein [Acetobacteraceae bacterium]|nr:alkaline phosphatase family protein [Acetobacteraceae bacterium]